MNSRYHIIKRGDRWAVKKAGNKNATNVFGTKDDAVSNAQKYRKSGSDVIIHKRDGSIDKWQKKKISSEYENNIFLNCPFDDEYMILLRPLIFTILTCGFNPRIALERLDSGEARFNKIKEIIEASQYSIHDLSRIKSSKIGEYYRLNMPFEIGLDFGCRLYNSELKYRDKKTLIFEGERYSCQKGLSDLAHSDVLCHNNEPEEIVYELRDWIHANTQKSTNRNHGSLIWDNYNLFYTELFEDLADKGMKEKDIDRMKIPELIEEMKIWLNENT